jgi:hypothetical protein
MVFLSARLFVARVPAENRADLSHGEFMIIRPGTRAASRRASIARCESSLHGDLSEADVTRERRISVSGLTVSPHPKGLFHHAASQRLFTAVDVPSPSYQTALEV